MHKFQVKQCSLRVLLFWVIIFLTLGGCSTYSEMPTKALQSNLSHRGYPALSYYPSLETVAKPPSEEYFEEALSLEQVSELTLRYQPLVQAELQRLRLQQGRHLQSLLPSNPGLSYKKLSNAYKIEIDRTYMLELIGFLSTPWRTSIENSHYSEEKAIATIHILQQIHQSQVLYLRWMKERGVLSTLEDLYQSYQTLDAYAHSLWKAGNIPELDYQIEHLKFLESQQAIAVQKQKCQAALLQFSLSIGLPLQASILKARNLPMIPSKAPSQIGSKDFEHHLSIQAQKQKLCALSKSLGLQQITRWIPILDLNYHHESASEEASLRGFEVTLQIPLFDWGQAKSKQAQALVFKRSMDTQIHD
jgi:hypothetical protein